MSFANPISRYYHWLHGRWPIAKTESLPLIDEKGASNVDGVFIIGELSGVPLLKFASKTACKTVNKIADEAEFKSSSARKSADNIYDLAIVGGGVAGISAAIEARKKGLNYLLLESASPLNTIRNFPKKKPIFTYPSRMPYEGGLNFEEKNDKQFVKETLLAELERQAEKAEIVYEQARVEKISGKKGKFDLLATPEKKGGKWRHFNARRVIVAIGKGGDYRKLNIPGENLGKVSNALRDPSEFDDKKVAVIGGGDSAVEAAIALAQEGASVDFVYRGDELTRPKAENRRKFQNLQEVGKIKAHFSRNPIEIEEKSIVIAKKDGAKREKLVNDYVFALVGREPPIEFFKRSGIEMTGERSGKWWLTLLLMLLFCVWVYHWKSEYKTPFGLKLPNFLAWQPSTTLDFFSDRIRTFAGEGDFWQRLSTDFENPKKLLGTIRISAESRSFYYTLAYCLLVFIFGIRRIFRRRTLYIFWQTSSLIFFQCVMLFILPEIIAPYLGNNGILKKSDWSFRLEPQARTLVASANTKNSKQILSKALQKSSLDLNKFTIEKKSYGFLADDGEAKLKIFSDNGLCIFYRYSDENSNSFLNALFPRCDYGHGREYWRAYGFILAWPLMAWNFFTEAPLWPWLVIGILQTFVIIPLLIKYWGKGAYCGWICSCGALAETLGDRHREKMPRGAFWNRMNMVGQIFLLFAFVLLFLKILSWLGVDWANNFFALLGKGYGGKFWQIFNYDYFVDLVFAGVLGVAFYFHFSGRIWCRFACPLAALMHIYNRLFGRFRIFADKKKCISCNVCTSVCHQGIDVMGFASRGEPMADPQCVRCSACVHSCPTGVLSFGRLQKK